MEEEKKNVWLVSAGNKGRDYSKYFLKHGILFVGGEKRYNRIKKIQIGDFILLRKDANKAIAVGEAVERNGEKHGIDEKSELLGDFDGWSLPYYHHIDWYGLSSPKTIKGSYRNAIEKSRKHKEALKKFAKKIIRNYKPLEVEPTPKRVNKVEDKQIINHLITEGLRPDDAEKLTNTFGGIRRLAQYYRKEGKKIKEHETRTFLVIPLLIALGWSEQQIKIEYSVSKGGTIDIACFDRPFHKKNRKCKLLIETKGIKHGLDSAINQVKGYANSFNDCNIIAVSNGFCYKVFKLVNEDENKFKIIAYLNLLSPTKKFHLNPEVGGALEVFSVLCPTVKYT